MIDTVTYAIRRLTPREFSLLAPQLVDIYIEAMDYSPSIHAKSVRGWRNDMQRAGFQAVIAEDDTGVVGMAYGFIGSPDTWWDQQLRRGLVNEGGPTAAQAKVLQNYFELAEIHVLPRCQGRGIGKQLAQNLLWNAPARHCLLSTPEVDGEQNNAFGLYRHLGFVDFLRNLRYPADTRGFAILVATLPLHPRVEQSPES